MRRTPFCAVQASSPHPSRDGATPSPLGKANAVPVHKGKVRKAFRDSEKNPRWGRLTQCHTSEKAFNSILTAKIKKIGASSNEEAPILFQTSLYIQITLPSRTCTSKLCLTSALEVLIETV